jgi:protein TonB
MPGAVSAGAPPPPPPAPSPKPAPAPTPTPEQRPIKVSEGVVLGSAIQKVYPPYPEIAKRARVSGAVQVQITISEEGRVIEASLLNGPPLLREVCLQAARQWVFNPTKLSRVPIRINGILTFNFRLDQ